MGKTASRARQVPAGQGAGQQVRVTFRVPQEAAAALGVSPYYFDDWIRDELRLIRRGRVMLMALAELQRWAERSAR